MNFLATSDLPHAWHACFLSDRDGSGGTLGSASGGGGGSGTLGSSSGVGGGGIPPAPPSPNPSDYSASSSTVGAAGGRRWQKTSFLRSV